MSTLPDHSPPAADSVLLRRFVREGSDASFRALAARFLPLVWSVARRVTQGDASLAEDVTQQVLADFAGKAGTLPPGMPPAGWLHRHTVFTAAKAVRSEARRRAREQSAAASDALTRSAMTESPDTAWRDLVPHLDAALDELPAADRTAILLRHFEQRGLEEVGDALGITGDAARKRIERAMDKLRARLLRRGVAPALLLTAALLGGNAVAAPPAALAQRILTAAAETWQAAPGISAPGRPRWLRRLPEVAAAGVVGALLWLVGAQLIGAGGAVRPAALPATPSARNRAGSPPAAAMTLTTTILVIPDSRVAGRLLHRTPGQDDAALFRELLPLARSLDAQIPAENSFATSGRPLAQLSGQITPQDFPGPRPGTPASAATEEEKRDPFAPHPGIDPFAPGTAEPDWLFGQPWFSGQRVAHSTAEYRHQGDWEHDQVKGLLTASGPGEMRTLGTTVTARLVPQPGREGVWLVCSEVKHNFSPPEEESWDWLPGVSPPPVLSHIRTLTFSAAAELIPAGPPVLAAMQTLTPAQQPAEDAIPRRVFLFFQLQP